MAAAAALSSPASDGEGSSGHILEDFSGGLVGCEQLSSALRRSVSRVEVVEGSERRWPQSHSARLRIHVGDEESGSSDASPRAGVVDLFLKKVVARCLPEKPLHALRRDLHSNRVEARFYREFAPLLAERGLRLLHAALVDERLSTLDDLETAADGAELAAEDKEQERRLRTGGVMLLLECAEDGYLQASPLDADQLRCTLRMLAQLHGGAWEDEALLRSASERLNRQAGYWTLQQRGAREMEQMERNWSDYLAAFRGEAPELFDRPGIVAMATRLRRIAPWVSEQVRAGPGDASATLVHGDFKAMNVFLPREDVESGTALPIDFQWIGPGLGMSDVAMHLSHSGSTGALRDGGEERLLEYYHGHLCQRLGPSSAAKYPIALARRHYQLGVLDWARMVFSVFFKGASASTFASKASNPNVGFVYRDVAASVDFVRRVDRCLAPFERQLGFGADASAPSTARVGRARSRSRSRGGR